MWGPVQYETAVRPAAPVDWLYQHDRDVHADSRRRWAAIPGATLRDRSEAPVPRHRTGIASRNGRRMASTRAAVITVIITQPGTSPRSGSSPSTRAANAASAAVR
jgi:hypothetical protein